jgi:hypothetical protein
MISMNKVFSLILFSLVVDRIQEMKNPGICQKTDPGFILIFRWINRDSCEGEPVENGCFAAGQ